MDHAQFEMQVAAILTAGLAGSAGVKDAAGIVALLTDVHKEITTRAAISKQSANFIPKGR
jgi:hypothetical protein